MPIGFGIASIKVEEYTKKYKVLPLVAITVFMFYFILSIKEIPDISILQEPVHVVTLLYTGVITSALAMVLEANTLTNITAEESSIILSTEPLWALETSLVVLHETLQPIELVGCVIGLLFANSKF